MKVAIIGGRNFADYKLIKFKLLPYRASITMIISGGAKGADKLAETYAKEHNLPVKVFESDWDDLEAEPCKIMTNSMGKPYNALAGFNRNLKIIKNSDFVVVFWDGKSKGTRDSLKKAHELKKDTLIIYYQVMTIFRLSTKKTIKRILLTEKVNKYNPKISGIFSCDLNILNRNRRIYQINVFEDFLKTIRYEK